MQVAEKEGEEMRGDLGMRLETDASQLYESTPETSYYVL